MMTMKKEITMRNKLDIIHELKERIECEMLVVTGSIALAFQGLIEPNECRDIDMLLYNPTPNGIAILNSLDNQAIDYGDDNLECTIYIFKYKGQEINIFHLTNTHPKNYCLSPSGLAYSTVMPIIKAKQGYATAGVEKHKRQLEALAGRIIKVKPQELIY